MTPASSPMISCDAGPGLVGTPPSSGSSTAAGARWRGCARRGLWRHRPAPATTPVSLPRAWHPILRVATGPGPRRECLRREATRGEKRRAEHRWCSARMCAVPEIPACRKFPVVRIIWEIWRLLCRASSSSNATSTSYLAARVIAGAPCACGRRLCVFLWCLVFGGSGRRVSRGSISGDWARRWTIQDADRTRVRCINLWDTSLNICKYPDSLLQRERPPLRQSWRNFHCGRRDRMAARCL